MSPILLAPLASAFIYAFAAMALKRASGGGIGPWRVAFTANWVQAIIFAPLVLLGGGPFRWEYLLYALVTGALFFVGQIYTFLALSRGDVSVVTPVLGTKVVLVAIFTVVLFHEHIPGAWWFAAALTVVATVLLGGGSAVKTSELSFRRSLLYGFIAATMYALTDVLVQRWARGWGFGHFAPAMFLVVALFSCFFIPYFSGPLRSVPAETWKWLIPGAVLLSVQAMGIAFSIMSGGDATLVNILYTSRGIWTIASVWAIGHWFGNTEHTHGSKVMIRRLVGAGLILIAVKLSMRG